MTFEQWRDKFQKKLPERKLASQAFRAWCEHREEFQNSAQAMLVRMCLPQSPVDSPFTADPKTYVLRSLYRETRPPSDEEVRQERKRRKEDEYCASPQSKTHQEQCILKSFLTSGPNFSVALNGQTRGTSS